ncbi:MAG: DegT/DnrJ/EryC1/StrS family aminotransferase [Bdellovibrionales bacterium]
MAPAYSPLLQQYLVSDLPSADDLRPYLRRIDQARWYTNFGPLACELEQTLAGLLTAADPHPENGAIHVTSMATCYQALEAGLRVLGVKPGDRVLVPAVSFPACPLAVQHAGAEVVMADIDASSWTLTPEIARRIAQKIPVAAVMPLALYGMPLPVAPWDAFSRDTGIPVIIDAAAAIESQPILHKGLVAHSLHATKPFGVGEGGALAARSRELIDKARLYSNFGTVERIAYSDGSNAKMSEYHAAVGLAQAARWRDCKQKRRDVLGIYRNHLKPLANRLSLHPSVDHAVVSLLMLRLVEPVAIKLVERSKNEGLALHQTYLPPLYRHPYYANVGLADSDGVMLSPNADIERKASHMANSETMHRHIVGVPFHPFLGEEHVAAVTAALRRLGDI